MKKFSTTAKAYIRTNKEAFDNPEAQVTATTFLHVADSLDNELSAALVTQYRYLLQTLEAIRAAHAGPQTDPFELDSEFTPAFN